MPDFVFRGASPGMYPMLRDLYDVPAGTVSPGDVLAFTEAPDTDWVPYEPASDPAPEPAAEPAADTPQDDGSQPDPSQQDDNAGQTGSEEQ